MSCLTVFSLTHPSASAYYIYQPFIKIDKAKTAAQQNLSDVIVTVVSVSQSIIIIVSVYNSGKHTWSKRSIARLKTTSGKIYLTVIATQIAEWQYPPAQTLKINKQQKQNQALCALGVNLAETLPFIKAALH